MYLAPLIDAGLQPTMLQLETTQTKEQVNIKLSDSSETKTPKDSDKHIPSVAYLQLRYGLSNECYHELATMTDDLPRSYQVRYLSHIRS